KEFTGRVRVCGIGIPETIKEKHPAACGLLTRSMARLLPFPDPNMHKGGAGHVLVVGGSLGLTGAPLLAALGALRCGCGLVTVACPGGLAREVKAANPDVMTWPLGDKETWSELLADIIKERLPQFAAVLIGPGLGRGPGARRFLAALLAMQLPKTILDADALYWLAQDKSLFEKNGRDTVLTPHPGEMALLAGKTIAEVQANRLVCAKMYAREKNVVLVLKGPGTVIAHPSGSEFLSPFTTPNLAVGGSGDVLAGILAGLTAQGLSPLDAACLGVYWHGRAGEILKNEYPYRGNLASEIPHILPRALKELRHV
ncbi:MAG: NAD(P)H-hydrate dehydratase, partial [Thermodesulfobacteriota bacterium]|nr:NAD(P)H-hydrate dehydratase [Thermodesulfobacteriota bacterium]